jgi:hypothetical protein
MTRPWYEDYFGPEFWTVAEHEYTAGHTGRVARKAVRSRGLMVKELPGSDADGETLLRIALPPSDARLNAFRTLFGLREPT